MCQIRIQGKTLPAMTDDTAKGLDRMRGADLRRIIVASETVFHLASQGGNQPDRPGLTCVLPANQGQGD